MQSSDERKAILNQVSKQVVDSFIDFSYQKAVLKPETDRVADYAKQVLSLGCFYLEFCIVKQSERGVGSVLYIAGITFYQYLLGLATRITVLNMLFQHSYGLLPHLSAELIWSHFVNVHGHPGKNIPADLHMEHLNRFVKEAIRTLV